MLCLRIPRTLFIHPRNQIIRAFKQAVILWYSSLNLANNYSSVRVVFSVRDAVHSIMHATSAKRGNLISFADRTVAQSNFVEGGSTDAEARDDRLRSAEARQYLEAGRLESINSPFSEEFIT